MPRKLLRQPGIYKITNPSGEIYIGGTTHLSARRINHKNLMCKTSKGIYNSLINYGWENHKWEVLKEFEANESRYTITFWEAWFYLKFKSGGAVMLNAIRPGSSIGIKKNRTKEFKRTVEQRNARSGSKNPMFGKSGKDCPSSLVVIDTNTGVIYESVKLASLNTVYKSNTLSMKLSGYRRNDTPFKYLEDARN